MIFSKNSFTQCIIRVGAIICMLTIWLGCGEPAKPASPEVKTAIKELGASIGIRRIGAAERLGNMGPDAEAAVPALVKTLQKDESIKVRLAAAKALQNIKSNSKSSISGLCAVVGKEGEQGGIRNVSMQALGEIGLSSPEVTRTLVNLMSNETDEVFLRATAAKTLAKLRPISQESVKALIDALAYHPKVAEGAIEGLASMELSAIPALTNGLKDSRREIRLGAATALGKMGTKASDTVPALCEVLKDPDAGVRARVALTLGEIGIASADCVNGLVESLQDNNANVVLAAVEALGTLGPEAAAGAPALIDLLNSDDRKVGAAAAIALGNIGAASSVTVPALIASLRSPHSEVRRRATEALTKIGPNAKEAVPTLLEIVEEESAGPYAMNKAHVISALIAIGVTREAVPVLIRVSDDRSARSHAIRALGAAGKIAVPLLADALKNDNPKIRSAAAEALSKIGTDAVEALPVLIEALDDPDWEVRQQVANALGSMGPKAEPAVGALAKMLRDGQQQSREFRARMGNRAIRSVQPSEYQPLCAVAAALGNIGLDTREAASALTLALQYDHRSLRNTANDAIIKIGPKGDYMVSALKECLKDPDEGTRNAASSLLHRMRVPLP
jgi:HEAT repeat protein